MARVIYWFRTDLRLHDSPALHAALDLKPAALFPLWCWDPNYVYKHRVGINRFRFLLQSMQDVSDSIQAINADSQLLVVRGDPVELLPELFKRWKISHLVFERDPSGYARQRDQRLLQLAKDGGVEVVSRNGHYLWDPEEVVAKNTGKPTMSMKALQGVVSTMGEPAKPIEKPESLPSPLLPDGSKAGDLVSTLQALNESLRGLPAYNERSGEPSIDLNSSALGGQRNREGRVTCYDSVVGSEGTQKTNGLFTVPTLQSLCMDPTLSGVSEEAAVPGGEHEGLRRLDEILKDASYISTFAKPKTSPSCDTSEPSTTLLSPFLKFGCLSVRRLWWDTRAAADSYKGKDKTTVPESYEGQLLFREMYACAEHAVGDPFQAIRANQVCRYMDWYLPTHYDEQGNVILPRPRGDTVSEERLMAFRAGQTGFPWIDAGARQLRTTGWIHHLMRHSMAAFLTRGQCWISWERGAEMFEEYLLDWDPNSNAGNWMWLSCSAFFSQFFRVYGLATFPVKYDKSGSLVRKYCPELKDFPDKFIYAPHTAPMEVQRKAKCIIGKDYPFPILDEKEEKGRCMNRCKVAFAQKIYGNSKEVMEGQAQEKLRKEHGEPDPQPPKRSPGRNEKIPEWARARDEATTSEMEPGQTDEHDEDAEEEKPGKERGGKRAGDEQKAGAQKKARRG